MKSLIGDMLPIIGGIGAITYLAHLALTHGLNGDIVNIAIGAVVGLITGYKLSQKTQSRTQPSEPEKT